MSYKEDWVTEFGLITSHLSLFLAEISDHEQIGKVHSEYS